MGKQLLYLFNVVFLFNWPIGSTAQVTFQKTIGGINEDEGFSIQQTYDGGYIIFGRTLSYGSPGINTDFYLIKIDSNGDTLWTRAFGGTGDDGGVSITQTSDSGFIMTGFTYSYGAGYSDIPLIKTDANGNLSWCRTYGGFAIDEGYSVNETSDGGYILAGRTSSYGAGNFDVCIIKTNANGDTTWTKIFGGALEDRGNAVLQTSDGGYIVPGQSRSFSSAGDPDIYLIKTDVNGSVMWSKTYGGNGAENAVAIIQTSSGYVISGTTNSNGANSEDYYLLSLDVNGNVIWTKTYGGIDHDIAYAMQLTTDGGYILGGDTYGLGVVGTPDYLIIRTDSFGDTLWSKTFGGIYIDHCLALQQTFDSGFILTGSTNGGSKNIYLIKTDANGNSGCNQMVVRPIIRTPVIDTLSSLTLTSSGFILNSFIPAISSGGVITTYCISTRMDEINSKDFFTIYPNPSKGFINVSFKSNISNGIIKLTDILGKEIFEVNISNELDKKINLINILNGIYFICVFDGEKFYSQKIIIERD